MLLPSPPSRPSTVPVAPGDPGSVFASVANSNAAFRNGFASGATVAQLQAQVPGFLNPNFNTVANKIYDPKYYEWNFELQQGLGKDLVFSANYVGNKGYQENNQTLFPNQYSATGFQGLPTTAPDARFGEIRQLSNQGYSNYNGLVTWLCAGECLQRSRGASLTPGVTPSTLARTPASSRSMHSRSPAYAIRSVHSVWQHRTMAMLITMSAIRLTPIMSTPSPLHVPESLA